MSENSTISKPENTSQNREYQYIDDEISLVDLAKTLIRNRKWFFTTFLLVTFLSVSYAFTQSSQFKSSINSATKMDEAVPAVPPADDKPHTQTFSSFLSLGYKTPDHYLEPMASVEAQILGAYYPLLIEANPSFADYRVEIEYTSRRTDRPDEGSNLMTITTHALAERRQEVLDFHQQLLMPVIEQHDQLVVSLNQRTSDAGTNFAAIKALPSRLVALAVPSVSTQPTQPTDSSQSNRPRPL